MKLSVMCCITHVQARNQGGEAHSRKCFAPPGKMCWLSFETTGHSSKQLGPSQTNLRPSWCLKLVTGLLMCELLVPGFRCISL